MRVTLILLGVLTVAPACGPVVVAQSNLHVSHDGRRIVTDDGAPFFWLGDTAWELLHTMIAYTPFGLSLRLDLSRLDVDRVRAWWFDPRMGVSTEIGSFPARGMHLFDPPGEPGRGNDWVLVVDDEGAGFPAPGKW